MSETGLVYTFTTPKLQPLVTKAEGKNLIQVSFPWHNDLAFCVWPILQSLTLSQACLNAPEPSAGNENGVDDGNAVDSPEEPPNAHLPPQQSRQGMQQSHMPPNYMPGMPVDATQLAYGYVQRGGQYLPQAGLQQHASHQS